MVGFAIAVFALLLVKSTHTVSLFSHFLVRTLADVEIEKGFALS